VWIAARAPMTYDYAVKNGCNIMSWPLTREMSEAELYMSRIDEAMAANPGLKRPIMAMMRQTAVYDRAEDWMVPVRAAQHVLSMFENLFKNTGEVENGFPKSIPLDQLVGRAEYDPEMLSRNLMFGTPEQVIAKLKLYEALGVDEFIYYASLGLGHAEQKRSMELFCKEVIPAFT
jgi:flavin-dependent trigonelline monooxygenase, oxygenase component